MNVFIKSQQKSEYSKFPCAVIFFWKEGYIKPITGERGNRSFNENFLIAYYFSDRNVFPSSLPSPK